MEGHWMTPLRRRRSWLVAAMVPYCCVRRAPAAAATAPAPAKVIFDKGTPFADLLVPKLTASVTDGAVGVTVDAPVTVTVADGVLGVGHHGQRERQVDQRSAEPRRPALVDHRAARLQQALHAEREGARAWAARPTGR